MSDPILRETNPFPDLLLVVLTICNVIALLPATIVAVFALAVSAAFWGEPSAKSALTTALLVSLPILHVGGPMLTWFRRGWPFEIRVVCLVLPLVYMALAARILNFEL